ncbi:TRAP transporter small permease [Phaeobacter gallaeciensis]|uniref:TRAP transporter small permease n=1 Tax=Phaeobacter gallaeciensis TaxID=60890 RepID=UPI00237FCCAF|nr:TRAP transporter small permease [Phaeobacter gallaeciensis]MDE4099300.1 TRAP transporter small permease [Phaeobacter gallaeciensis]MDE4108071.1 TRAP transporter small permease [Phaeobacter gallaeciensis]MDE4112564.1 TRAP transporter small permease [Phaeobacter gallaeciensis]MDE4117035.1 TRAP transporter small permease [Phaeobacter gallaeciensis]MDE4121507.1 TRAP transporter small permease [Phaeobacter gallaeciensis]
MHVFARFVTALALVAAVLFVLAGVMLTYEVMARYFFVRPTIWAAELSQFCLIWGSLIAAPWCLRERRHIRITAVISGLPSGPRIGADVFAMAVVAVFSAVVLVYGYEIFHDSFMRGRTTGTMLDMPMWYVELSLPFGFAVLLVQSVIEVWRAAQGHIAAEGEHE